MNFETYSITSPSARTFTAQEQAQAWESFIQQDDYLREHRGRYAERGAVFLPMATRADLSVTQDLFRSFGGRRNTLQLRLDILNVGNLLNDDWGVGERLVTNTPLIARGADASGAARYRLRNLGASLVSSSRERTAGLGDVYRFQLGLRYLFE
jgi:hypothetical protein